MSAPSNWDNIHEAQILNERVRYSLTFLNVNLALIPSGAALSCWATWEYVGGWRALAWICLLAFVCSSSYLAFRKFNLELLNFTEVKRLEHLLGWNSVGIGLCYGFGAFSLYGASPVSDLAILLTVMIMLVGVATSYFAQTKYAKLNSCVILGPSICYLGAQPSTLYRILFFVSVLCLLRALGLINQYSGYFHDLNHLGFALVAEKNEAERNFQDLQRSETLRHKLTQMIVHDLRTPLTSIVGHLHLIKRKSVRGEPESALKNLEKVQSLSSDLVTMVNDILEVSRSEDKQIPLLLRKTSWEEISGLALEDLGKARQQVQVIGEQLVEGCWDVQLLRRVLVNLLSNAVRFSPSEETVVMEVQRDEQYLLVSIRDKGPGVPEGAEEHVFEQYYSAENHDSVLRGFGIGLYFCKLAVEKHKGQIGCRRCGDIGAEFWFRLPLNQEAPA